MGIVSRHATPADDVTGDGIPDLILTQCSYAVIVPGGLPRGEHRTMDVATGWFAGGNNVSFGGDLTGDGIGDLVRPWIDVEIYAGPILGDLTGEAWSVMDAAGGGGIVSGHDLDLDGYLDIVATGWEADVLVLYGPFHPGMVEWTGPGVPEPTVDHAYIPGYAFDCGGDDALYVGPLNDPDEFVVGAGGGIGCGDQIYYDLRHMREHVPTWGEHVAESKYQEHQALDLDGDGMKELILGQTVYDKPTMGWLDDLSLRTDLWTDFPIGLPLVVPDFSGDGLDDFVVEAGDDDVWSLWAFPGVCLGVQAPIEALGVRLDGGTGAVFYNGTWTDLDGDGLADVVQGVNSLPYGWTQYPPSPLSFVWAGADIKEALALRSESCGMGP